MGHWWRKKESGKPKYSEKNTLPNANIFITNPTWTAEGSNPEDIRWDRDNKQV
jgi:hypothetical protein